MPSNVGDGTPSKIVGCSTNGNERYQENLRGKEIEITNEHLEHELKY
jgi:hypothetical protein